MANGKGRRNSKCTMCDQHKKTINKQTQDIAKLEQANSGLSQELQKAQTQVTGTTVMLQESRDASNRLQKTLNGATKEKASLARLLEQEAERAALLAKRIEDAETEAGSLVQAEVEQRKAALAAQERQVRANCDTILSDASQQASEQLERAAEQASEQRTRAAEQARILLDEAVTSAGETRSEAQAKAAAIFDEANRTSEDLVAKASREAAETHQAAQKARDALVAEAEAEAAEIRGQASRQKNQWESEAQQTLETARAAAAQLRQDAEIAAQREAARITAEARAKAALERKARLDEVEEELRVRSEALEERETKCRTESDEASGRLIEAKRLEAMNERERAELEARQRRCEEREAELDAEHDRLADRRRALDEQDARLGAQHVERLEQRLKEAEDRLEGQREIAMARAQEVDTLRNALDEVGGAEALARTQELEQLRERVAKQSVEIASLHDDERIHELELEIKRLEPYRERFGQLQQQRLEEERASATAEQRVIELRDQLRDGQRERDTLASKLQLAEQQRDELQVVEQQARNHLRDNELLQIERDHLEVVSANLSRKLQTITGEAKKQAARHYGSLVSIDEQAQQGPPDHLAEDPSTPRGLAQLANKLRQSMAAEGRYYDLHTVRALLGSMAASRIILLKGISGTGKTSLPLFAADAMGAPRLRVPVQSSWRDRADLLGFYNSISEQLNASKFTEAIYRARTPGYADRPNFLVLDEANLSRVEYYFADFLSELEDDTKDQHTVTLLDQAANSAHPEYLVEGRELVIPPNTWFFLTANEDESTFEIADKTFDRASVMQLDIRAEHFSPTDAKLHPVSFEGLRRAFDRAAASFSMDEPKAFLDSLEGVLKKELRIGYGNRFDKQLPAFAGVYVKSGGQPGPALDHFVRSKILRRLELVRDPGLKPAVQLVRDVFDIWPYDPHEPEQCTGLLDQILRRLD